MQEHYPSIPRQESLQTVPGYAGVLAELAKHVNPCSKMMASVRRSGSSITYTQQGIDLRRMWRKSGASAGKGDRKMEDPSVAGWHSTVSIRLQVDSRSSQKKIFISNHLSKTTEKGHLGAAKFNTSSFDRLPSVCMYNLLRAKQLSKTQRPIQEISPAQAAQLHFLQNRRKQQYI